MSQFSVPCSVYRGGTSRGLFFHKNDLPTDVTARNKIFLTGIDAYNLSQINGLGSGTSHTSKVCVISPSTQDGADVDFMFYQVGIGVQVVDEKGTCGNLMSAVGAFSVDEGLVPIGPAEKSVTVSVYNVNIKKILKIQVPVVNGKAQVNGDYQLPGVVKPGAMIRVAILNPGGGKTGETLLFGTKTSIKNQRGAYKVSFVDIINPFVFIAASDVGLNGTEPSSQVSGNKELIEELNLLRDEMAVAAQMANNVEEARIKSGSIPKIAVVAEYSVDNFHS